MRVYTRSHHVHTVALAPDGAEQQVQRWLKNKHIFFHISVTIMMCGPVWQRQVSRFGTSNYIPQILWDVITCTCPWWPTRSYDITCHSYHALLLRALAPADIQLVSHSDGCVLISRTHHWLERNWQQGLNSSFYYSSTNGGKGTSY